jgi:A/G-specific adenine glycosylase
LTPLLPDPAEVSGVLVAWIRAHRRDFPWRRRRDPYAVWISEVMLQQTQAATVVPYFERWMDRFPDVSALAAAPLDDVLKAWEGLGYYARARSLHRAAQRIVAEHGGRIPAHRDALLALPGVGPYTAGAILSLAFGQAEPIVDGNVRRVLCRVYHIPEDPAETATVRILWGLAESLVGAVGTGAAGDMNEALMELGAVLCTPREPRCTECPLGRLCLAYAQGTQEALPATRKKPAAPLLHGRAAVICDASGRYLIVRRPDEGLLGGLWGFPNALLAGAQPPDEQFRQAMSEQLGIEVEVGATVARVKHAYTHFRLALDVVVCDLVAGAPQPIAYSDVRWLAIEEIAQVAIAATDHKILATL